MLHTCGRAEDPKTAERLRNLARSSLKRCDPPEIVPHSTQGRLVDAWPYGPLDVLEALWQRLGFAEIIADHLKGRKLDFAVGCGRSITGRCIASTPTWLCVCWPYYSNGSLSRPVATPGGPSEMIWHR